MTETPADDARAAENAAHFLGRGVGGDVEILGRATENQVANRAADNKRGITGFLQGIAGAQGAAADALTADAVFGHGNDPRFRGLEHAARKHAAEKLGDHAEMSVSAVCRTDCIH